MIIPRWLDAHVGAPIHHHQLFMTTVVSWNTWEYFHSPVTAVYDHIYGDMNQLRVFLFTSVVVMMPVPDQLI